VKKSAKAEDPESRQRKKPERQPKISRGPLRMTVPQAGRLIGLSRNSAYTAAQGEIPTMKVGSLLIVPKRKWLAMIGVADDVA
jgi:hypothetical protein